MSKHCVVTEEKAPAFLGSPDRISERTGCLIWISWGMYWWMKPQEPMMNLFTFFFKSQSSSFSKRPDALLLKFQQDCFTWFIVYWDRPSNKWGILIAQHCLCSMLESVHVEDGTTPALEDSHSGVSSEHWTQAPSPGLGVGKASPPTGKLWKLRSDKQNWDKQGKWEGS